MSQRALAAGPEHLSIARTALTFVAYETLCRGIPDETDLERRRTRLQGLLDILSANPSFSMALYLSSATLGCLAASTHASALRSLVEGGQLELLTGGPFAPLLPAMPEFEAEVQLRHHMRQLRDLTGVTPTGIWLTGKVFSPHLVPLLTSCGLQYTFLHQLQLSAVTSDVHPGVPLFATERTGQRLLLLGTHPVLSDALRNHILGLGEHVPTHRLTHRPKLVSQEHGAATWLAPPVQRWLEDLKALASSQPDFAASLAVIACPLDEDPPGRVEKDPFITQISRLMLAVQDQPDRFAFQLPKQVVQFFSPTAMAWPGDSVPPRVGFRLMSPTRAQALESVTHHRTRPHDAAADRALSSTVQALATQIPWEVTLARYPEQNRLHKRLLLLASRMSRMQSLLRDRAERGEDVSLRVRAYERMRSLYLEVWNQAALWPGPYEGMSRPAVRASLRRRLMEIQRLLDSLLISDTRYVGLEVVDLDRDTRDEILVSTPRLEALISPLGGAILELASKSPFVSVCDLPQRRLERFHQHLIGSGISPVKKRPSHDLKPFDPHLHALASHLKQDRYARGCFIDHILGPSTTLDNFAASQFLEAGDLVQTPYERLGLEYRREEGQGIIQLARNATLALLPGGGGRSSVRVDKRIRIDDAGRWIVVEYALRNRGHAPVNFQFGVELGINHALRPQAPFELDERGRLVKGEWSADWLAARALATRAPVTQGRGASGVAAGVATGVAAGVSVESAAEGAGEPMADSAANATLQKLVPQVDWVDPASGVTVKLTFSEQARLWWFPLDLILPDESGVLALEPQGHIFLPHWDIALWGGEEQSLQLTLRFEEPEASEATIEDDADAES